MSRRRAGKACGERMEQSRIDEAARALIAARSSGTLLSHLSAALMPHSAIEAHAIQDAITRMLGEDVVAYKVGAVPGEDVVRGAILASRLHQSGAKIGAAAVPFLGVESEVAFRLKEALPARAHPYQRAEIIPLLEACPAIEILDTAFSDFHALEHFERVADHFGNGGLVCGAFTADWQHLDFLHLAVTLDIGGKRVVEATGGHPTGDAMLPVVALANLFRTSAGLPAGLVVTTGSFTGLSHARPGDTAVARFAGFGEVDVTFTA